MPAVCLLRGRLCAGCVPDAMYKKASDSVDAACGSRVGPFSKLQLEADGNGSTEQADGVGRRAGRRSRPTGRPTE